MTAIPERPRRRADVVLRELGTAAMLYDPEADRVVKLNATARRVWECCDGSRDVAAIVASVRAAFAVAADVDLEADVRRALQVFAGAALLLAS